MVSATSATLAPAMASGVGHWANSFGVTLLTCASVVCVESSTAMSSLKGFSWSKKHSTGP